MRGGHKQIRSALCKQIRPVATCAALQAIYTTQFGSMAAMTKNTKQRPFLVRHYPLFGLGCCTEADGVRDGDGVCTIDSLLVSSLNSDVASAALAHFSGHMHFFQTTRFGHGTSPSRQFVVGTGGTYEYTWIVSTQVVENAAFSSPPESTMSNTKQLIIKESTNLVEFGFGSLQLTRTEQDPAWRFDLYATTGSPIYSTIYSPK